MTDRDDQLLQTLARRNWLILLILLFLSLPWRSLAISGGVLCGGLVAIVGFHWLHFALVRILVEPGVHPTRKFRAGYIVRLATLVAILYLLVAIVRVHPVALVAGLSVVVLNLLWTTLRRSF